MPLERITLSGKPYQESSLIASAQRCVNLIAESNADDDQAPVPVTYYYTPGTSLHSQTANNRKVRCTFRASTGQSYVVIGPNVYFLAANRALVPIGVITDRESQVYMADNGLAVVLVDGVSGWVIQLGTNLFAPIIDPSFYGADYVVFLDTFFVFNRPDTNQFYISLSMVDYALLSGTAVGSGIISNAGANYTSGFYADVPLTGGSGTGAKADITITPAPAGPILTGSITTGGTLYGNGVYPAVPLTGGSGTGATANITVAGGIVTAVTIVNPGINYVIADILSASNVNLGGTGSGFTYTVNSIQGIVTNVSIVPGAGRGEGYLVGDILSANSADIGGTGAGFTFTITAFEPAFDPLDIAAKSGSADHIVGIFTTNRDLWLVGELTTEPWIGTGSADFYFQQVQGAYIDHGCIAQYSIASQDKVGFWLMQDRQGKNIVVQSSPYTVKEVSTPAIVKEFNTYLTTADAIGFCFQQQDHAYYVLAFPTADKTWLYDLTTKQWTEWNYADSNGNLHRSRANCCMFAYGYNLIGDWETGILWQLNWDKYTDGDPLNPLNEIPIVRIRTFPHLLANGNRVTYNQFIADMECGNAPEGMLSAPVTLRWSDDRGKSYGNGVTQSLGLTGEFLKQLSWNRLGMARDRVFEISWSVAAKTSVNGAFIDATPSKS